MHCRLEKAYHTALFVPPPEPYHHCEIYFCKFERDLDKPPGDPVWDCQQSDPDGLSWTLENGIDGVKVSVSPVHILEWGFVQMSWRRLCCVLEDHPDSGSPGSRELWPEFCPLLILLFRAPLSLGIWRVGKMFFRLQKVEGWGSSGSPGLLEHITAGHFPGQTVGAPGVVEGGREAGTQPQLF